MPACRSENVGRNGRLYAYQRNPYLQRFLSPDPYIQSPGNAQNFNRYSYCLNNPLMFTDPSGYRYEGGMSPSEAWYAANWMCLGNPNLSFAQVYSHMAMDGWAAGGGGSAAGGGWAPNWKVRAERYRDPETGRYYTRIGGRLYGYTWSTTNYWVYNKESRRAGLWGWELWCVNRRVYYSIEQQVSDNRYNGLLNNDIYQVGIAINGLVNSASTEAWTKSIKYVSIGSTEVQAQKVLSKIVRGTKYAGWIGNTLNLSISYTNAYINRNDSTSGYYQAQAIASTLIVGLNALNFVVPGLGTVLSISAGAIDAAGGFDWIYETFND